MPIVVIFEQGEKSIGASSPDFPGCIAVGKTREETEKLFTEALQMHLDGLREDGEAMNVPD